MAPDLGSETGGLSNQDGNNVSSGGAPANTNGGSAVGGGSASNAGGMPNIGAGGSSAVPAGAGGSMGTGGTSGNGSATGGAWTPAGGGAPVTSGGAPVTSGGAPVTSGGAATGGAPGGTSSGGQLISTGGISGTTGGASTGGAAGGGVGTGGTPGTPSSGCSVTDAPTGTTIDGTMKVGGQTREYRLSVPTDYKPGEALPLIFVLNGVGGTGPQAQQSFGVETGHRAIFIYPTSLPNSEAGGSIAWDFDQNGVDMPYFDALVAYLEQNYCIDTSRIFALGASSGGIMSNMLGCFRGDVLRAIAPSSGMTWSQSGCKGDVAVMVICGAQDTYNACNDAKNGGLSQTNVWVPQNGCSQQNQQSPISSICQEFTGCKTGDPVLLCTHAGGHGWPTSDGDFWWQFFMSLS